MDMQTVVMQVHACSAAAVVMQLHIFLAAVPVLLPNRCQRLFVAKRRATAHELNLRVIIDQQAELGSPTHADKG